MKNRYILIINDNTIDPSILKEFFLGILGPNISLTTNEKYILVKHNDDKIEDIKENIKAFIYDTNFNIKCYLSNELQEDEELYNHVEMIYNYLSTGRKENVYDDRLLINELTSVTLNDYKAFILKDYLFDNEMQEIIKAFLLNNMNVLQTAKVLYMHRNTLLNKLERFYEKTGYDIRNFEDAYLIYSLIK